MSFTTINLANDQVLVEGTDIRGNSGSVVLDGTEWNAMQERNRRVEISQDRILEELANIAFGDLRDAVTWGPRGVSLKDSKELTDEQAAAISEVGETVTKDGGSTRIKRHDKVKALELLMRHKGMLNDKLNINGELNVSALGKGRERAKERI